MRVTNGELQRAIRRMVKSSMMKLAAFKALHENINAEFDELESIAKESYVAAKAALDEFDANLKLKAAYDAKYTSLVSSGMTKVKARQIVDADPALRFNKNLLSRKRETLVNALAAATEKYAQFRPDKFNYARTKRPAVRAAATKNDFTKPIIDISKIVPLKWHAWPKAVKSSGLSYGVNASDDSDSSSGIGPGEEWAALLLGGAIQGGNIKFDIELSDGTRWEVKQVANASKDQIRPMVEGRNAVERARRRLNAIMNQMLELVEHSMTVSFDDETQVSIDYVKGFLDDQYDLIVKKGEISRERFIDIRTALMIMHNVKKGAEKRLTQTSKRINVGAGDSDVDSTLYAKIVKRLHSVGYAKEVKLDESELIVSVLEDSAFDDPKEFIKEWFNSVDPVESFPDVDGLIIVNRESYCIVPRAAISTALKFMRISQGLPRFKFML